MAEPVMVRPHHLAGLCLVTESNLPSEWPALLQVMLNRVASPRYPDSIEAVILQPKQFSRFNLLTGKAKGSVDGYSFVYRKVVTEDIRDSRIDPLLMAHAQDFVGSHLRSVGEAQLLGIGGLICPAISPETLHYYSPVSMVPNGSAPAWATTAKRIYAPEGVDPDRFTFCEGVR